MDEETAIAKTRAAQGAWEAEVLAKRLAGTGERKSTFTTLSGDLEVRRLYTPLDVEHLDYMRDLGFPGAFAFTREGDPMMYRGSLWVSSQYSGFGSAEDANERYRYLLSQGQKRLFIAMRVMWRRSVGAG
ncbi:MAG: hypothetical protein HY675_06760 [Chloroflexi bacterium]|nr:hypothetical protein [Chloroflexota bacterium]